MDGARKFGEQFVTGHAGRVSTRAVLLALLFLCCALCPLGSRAAGPRDPSISVVFHVAPSTQHRAEIEPFIAQQLAQANEVFRAVPLHFVDGGRKQLPAQHAILNTRADRDALLVHVRPGAVDCMVVAKLMDVDEAGRERRGVHWYPAHKARPHMVIVSTLASAYVLAHELGHYFGNPRHSSTASNLMSYDRGDSLPFLDAQQRKRIRRSVARMRAQGELPKTP